jgi:patatin-like phospholipase/acyl hydrolase
MPGSDLRLLVLDGGGVRGLSALMILEQLMEAVDPDAPLKPCDYFDMIGGTSAGGWIVTTLSRYTKSVLTSGLQPNRRHAWPAKDERG